MDEEGLGGSVIEKMNIVKQYAVSLTPIRTGSLQSTVKVTKNAEGFEITWGGGRVNYAAFVNNRGKSAGYADRAAQFIQSFFDGMVRDTQTTEVDSGNQEAASEKNNTAFVSTLNMVKKFL